MMLLERTVLTYVLCALPFYVVGFVFTFRNRLIALGLTSRADWDGTNLAKDPKDKDEYKERPFQAVSASIFWPLFWIVYALFLAIPWIWDSFLSMVLRTIPRPTVEVLGEAPDYRSPPSVTIKEL